MVKNSRRNKGNLVKDFRYTDLTEREQSDVIRAMNLYNNQGGNTPKGLDKKYNDPNKFYEQIIKVYGWGGFIV